MGEKAFMAHKGVRKGKFALAAAALGAALALTACASSTPGANLDKRSVEYFQVAVGDRIYFATDRTDLTPEAQAVLQRQAEWLKQNPNIKVRIEGHADERGTREYNLALGARRAESVTNYLASLGVPRNRLQPVSFGKERPVETCSQDACWAKNRRSVTAPI